MSYAIIKNDDTIIGFVDDINSYLKDNFKDYDDEEQGSAIVLALELKNFGSDDLVKCVYHPMGAWYVQKCVSK